MKFCVSQVYSEFLNECHFICYNMRKKVLHVCKIVDERTVLFTFTP
jgi:hypothetical protein